MMVRFFKGRFCILTLSNNLHKFLKIFIDSYPIGKNQDDEFTKDAAGEAMGEDALAPPVNIDRTFVTTLFNDEN